MFSKTTKKEKSLTSLESSNGLPSRQDSLRIIRKYVSLVVYISN